MADETIEIIRARIEEYQWININLVAMIQWVTSRHAQKMIDEVRDEIQFQIHNDRNVLLIKESQQ